MWFELPHVWLLWLYMFPVVNMLFPHVASFYPSSIILRHIVDQNFYNSSVNVMGRQISKFDMCTSLPFALHLISSCVSFWDLIKIQVSNFQYLFISN